MYYGIYNDYEIHRSGERGGKAGRNKASTGTIQVRDLKNCSGGSFLLMAQIRFTIGQEGSEEAALGKAKIWVNEHPWKSLSAKGGK